MSNTTDEKNSYVYALIDPETDLPFYIGMSSNKKFNSSSFEATYYRPYAHHITSKIKNFFNNKKLDKKYEKILKILESEKDVKVEILADNLTLEQARIKEKEFISMYGRIGIDKDGILFNITSGGECHKLNENSRRKLSEIVKRRFQKDANLHQKYSENAKHLWQNAEYREKVSVSCREYYNINPEIRKKISAESKERWNDENYRKKCSNVQNYFTKETALKANRLAYEKCLNLREISKQNIIRYNKSEKGRNESKNRAAHMRKLFDNLSPKEKELASLKRKIGAYLPRDNGTHRLKLKDLTLENISKNCLDFS